MKRSRQFQAEMNAMVETILNLEAGNLMLENVSRVDLEKEKLTVNE